MTDEQVMKDSGVTYDTSYFVNSKAEENLTKRKKIRVNVKRFQTRLIFISKNI